MNHNKKTNEDESSNKPENTEHTEYEAHEEMWNVLLVKLFGPIKGTNVVCVLR